MWIKSFVSLVNAWSLGSRHSWPVSCSLPSMLWQWLVLHSAAYVPIPFWFEVGCQNHLTKKTCEKMHFHDCMTCVASQQCILTKKWSIVSGRLLQNIYLYKFCIFFPVFLHWNSRCQLTAACCYASSVSTETVPVIRYSAQWFKCSTRNTWLPALYARLMCAGDTELMHCDIQSRREIATAFGPPSDHPYGPAAQQGADRHAIRLLHLSRWALYINVCNIQYGIQCTNFTCELSSYVTVPNRSLVFHTNCNG